MFVIMNMRDGRYVYGTDRRGFPKFYQRLSLEKALTFDTLAEAKIEFRNRRCGKSYRIAKAKQIQITELIPFDDPYGYCVRKEDWESFE